MEAGLGHYVGHLRDSRLVDERVQGWQGRLPADPWNTDAAVVDYKSMFRELEEDKPRMAAEGDRSTGSQLRGPLVEIARTQRQGSVARTTSRKGQ